MHRLAERVETFGHLKADIAASDNRHAVYFAEHFVNTKGVLKIDKSKDVFEVSAGNVREPRLHARCDEQALVGKLHTLPRVRPDAHYAPSRRSDFVNAGVGMHFDAALFFKGFRGVGNEVLRSDHLCKKVRDPA